LSGTPDAPGVVGWGAACPRVCSYLVLRDKATGRRLCFANTHTDHVSAEAREKGMLLIIERMKAFGDGAPIIFTGDHNCRETEAPAAAVSKMLVNALYESETPPRGPWRTFNGWKWRDAEPSTLDALKESPEARNAPERECRIDYIYATRGARVLDYATVADARPGKRLYPSDHYPVVATMEL
jgi:endonuclease/exonuclease/phosphatase family metal-dependent hydrolase